MDERIIMNLKRRTGQYFTGQWVQQTSGTTKDIRYAVVNPIHVTSGFPGTPDLEMIQNNTVIKTSNYLPYQINDSIVLQDGIPCKLLGYTLEYRSKSSYHGRAKNIIEYYLLSLDVRG